MSYAILEKMELKSSIIKRHITTCKQYDLAVPKAFGTTQGNIAKPQTIIGKHKPKQK
jgi:hypothetical protein